VLGVRAIVISVFHMSLLAAAISSGRMLLRCQYFRLRLGRQPGRR
jgi:hypothetical protein